MPSDFEAYVAARGPALQRFAYLVTRDRAESADLVQDVLEALESFEAPSGKDSGVKAGATVGAPRSGGKSSEG